MVQKHIVLLDGDCSFCSATAQFIIKRDPANRYSFASLQSETGKKILEKLNVQTDDGKVMLIENGTAFSGAEASLRILKNLDSPLRHFSHLLILPTSLLDIFYRLVAKFRSMLPGRDYCEVQEKYRDRFIDL